MKFVNAASVEDVCWSMKLADYNSQYQRSLINNLADGFPPYTEDEQRENGIEVNVNFLALTKITHDCRRQFFNAFLNSNQFFKVNIDFGPVHLRGDWSQRVTKAINRRMKQSLKYFEGNRSNHAALALHGIGPSVWFDRQKWCPTAVGIEDVLIPARTLLTMENLPFFSIFVQYTARELYDLTHGPRPDPGWNMDIVDRALRWADQEYRKEVGHVETYSPEKVQQMIKENRGAYDGDAVPTIDTWHFFFWDDSAKHAGWCKRIILDSPAPFSAKDRIPEKSIIGSKGDFLFNPGSRKYADSLSEIIHFQFGDASSVGPFRYHSVRSLGFLVYAACHLQNRLQCQFNHSAFESLMQYFRCNSPEDSERLTKVDLVNKGIIPDGIEFVKAQERWQVNEGLVGSVMGLNRQSIVDSSTSYTQDLSFADGSSNKEKTATEVMAEVNATSALVGSMLNQAYAYSEFQYREICRRFTIPNSKDSDVRKFRCEVLKDGVPEDALNLDRWDVTSEKVLGGGNKTLQFAQIDKLMQARTLMDPEPQREVLHDAVMVWTDDADRADRLAPISKQQMSDSKHDAQLAVGTLMAGLPVELKTGMNHIEYVETMLAYMTILVQRAEQMGGMMEPDTILGLQTMAQHIGQHIGVIAQDENEQQRVKKYGDVLGKIMNLVKAYAQRLQEQQSDAGAGPAGIDAETTGKLKADQTIAEAKAANMRESHAAKTAQRQVAFDLDQRRKNREHDMAMRERAQDAQLTIATEGMKTAAQIRQEGIKAAAQPTTEQ